MPNSLRFYNTLSRSKEVFEPLDPANVRLYVCGPTVYDYAHIGNARPLIVFDVLFRLLRHRYGPEHVVYARNVTDVDDKINARAARDFPDLPLNEAIARVTQATERQFREDAAALGCLSPTVEPHATAHIGEMRALIERLVARGLAYIAEDNVLFSPAAMDRYPGAPRYGSLARRSLDEMIAGARVDVAPYKRDPMDFVLWKPSKPGEPGWPSPCGITAPGRPGWHIECSAMSMAKLLAPFGGGLTSDDPAKNIFDIHGGGIDLVFPHHENEIAQSCCALDTPRMANVWMHNGFLQVEGEKMSKSLGNFVTIRELLTGWKGEPWAGPVIRYAMLGAHYRQPIDWTFQRLTEAKANVHAAATYAAPRNFSRKTAYEEAWSSKEVAPSPKVLKALEDDLNLPEALSHLNGAISRVSSLDDAERIRLVHDMRFLGILEEPQRQWLADGIALRQIPQNLVGEATMQFRAYRVGQANNDLCSIASAEQWFAGHEITVSTPDLIAYAGFDRGPGRIETLIDERNAARARKDWKESDRLRDELAAMRVIVKDNKDGSTTWEIKP
jgi:cysteinyl-tRNA synthetase